MSGKIITPSLKRKITQKWSDYFPEFGIYKPMWLMNVCGPLAVGIALLVKSDKTVYEPIMHIHNLCVPDDTVSLNIPIESKLLYIKSEDDRNEYISAIHYFRNKSYIPFEGDVDCKELIENMKKHFETTLYKANLLKIMLYISIWSDSHVIYNNVKSFVDMKIENHPDMFGDESIKRNFINTFPNNLSDCGKIRDTVIQQKQVLGLNDLPQRKLVIND